MHPLRRSVPAGARVHPALPAALLLLSAVAVPVQGQGVGGPAPARASAADFLGLRWLEGTWRGRMQDGRHFYERYTLVNDSTFAVEAFADSTLGAPRDGGRVSLRGHAVYREATSGERVPATRLARSGVLFGTAARGFTWAPGSDGAWTATIHWVDSAGTRRDAVYQMERLLAPSASVGSGGAAERERAGREGVERAVLDYVDALYLVDPSRIERSVHPELAKRGFSRPEGSAAYQELRMSYEQLRDLAGRWNRSGRVDPRTAVREIVVFDVLDQTATAKLVADWGIDYLHLARYDGRWRIVNVLWQSPPPAGAATSGP